MLGHCSISYKTHALQALMFVRDLDTSLLGQNANGLEQFECLRQCTDELVNAILHVRQLLKRRRFDEGELSSPKSLVCPAAFRAYVSLKKHTASCQAFSQSQHMQ